MQYTIRNIPPDIDRALKARAKQLGKSVNQLALDALAQSLASVSPCATGAYAACLGLGPNGKPFASTLSSTNIGRSTRSSGSEVAARHEPAVGRVG